MERRHYPRIDTEHPAELLDGSGTPHPAHATNISLSGLQVRCDQKTALAFAPKGQATHPRDIPELRVRMSLPLKDRSTVRVEARCKVISFRRVAADDFRFGLQYEFFEGRSYQALEAYIDDWVTFPEDQ